jgi:rRNA-processing protein FCF1
MNDIIIDTNVLVLLIIGAIDPLKISQNKRTSVYTEKHYHLLHSIICKHKIFFTVPNIITEIDNLLSNIFYGDKKIKYRIILKDILEKSIEKYFESKIIIEEFFFDQIGLTDSIILKMAENCNSLLISDDSKLCDYARSRDIKIVDFKKIANESFLEEGML